MIFDPTKLENPFGKEKKGSVHLWHWDEDMLVPTSLRRYIVKKLPWIHYHQIPVVGHFLSNYDGKKKAILKAVLLGEYQVY
ncbi:hypothetical protein Ccrd_016583 [Cynara cardunculus var. scolymus]|uniref:Uncharacterized protein n=1 Tax=Cynara cardunculus var. scolymus TaxID=59895 RepID=A0A103Y9M6_CYNCS|nr:hypothetical protein Ccrd_016583 [Cynara cardunculus var. scolymus]